jgi:carbon monoxide dehydrogenase subunit G
MRIENTVEVDAPLERVWALVNDIPRVAPCMPGAALTGAVDDKTYEGTVAVKLGPLRMSYKGKVTVDEIDDASHSARLTASGRDTKGAGTAKANVETRLEAASDTRTRLHVASDVQLTGKVASFGRGGAINDVATRLFGQFADCLRATLEGEGAAATTAASAAAETGSDTGAATAPTTAAATGLGGPTPTGSATTEAAGAGAAPATSADATAAGAAPATSAGAAPPSGPVAAGDGTTTAGASAAATPTAAVPATQPPRGAEALDAGSLVGTVIKGRLRAFFTAIANFFRRLFGRRPTG